jgi:hypothetical protein
MSHAVARHHHVRMAETVASPIIEPPSRFHPLSFEEL